MAIVQQVNRPIGGDARHQSPLVQTSSAVQWLNDRDAKDPWGFSHRNPGREPTRRGQDTHCQHGRLSHIREPPRMAFRRPSRKARVATRRAQFHLVVQSATLNGVPTATHCHGLGAAIGQDGLCGGLELRSGEDSERKLKARDSAHLAGQVSDVVGAQVVSQRIRQGRMTSSSLSASLRLTRRSQSGRGAK